MQEFPGTAFLLTHEARYKWKHGLAPVSAVRVSVTCRFFKTDVFGNYMTSIGAPKKLKSWQQRRLKRQQEEQQNLNEDGSVSSYQQTTATKVTTPTKEESTSSTTANPEPQQQPASPTKQETAETEAQDEHKKPEDVHIELCLNKDSHQTKPAVVSASADIKQLIAAAKNKLRVKAKKVQQIISILP